MHFWAVLCKSLSRHRIINSARLLSGENESAELYVGVQFIWLPSEGLVYTISQKLTYTSQGCPQLHRFSSTSEQLGCNKQCLLRRFESWVGQTAKVLSAGYIAYKAGGPKDAYFSKEAQEELHTAQTVCLSKGIWVSAVTSLNACSTRSCFDWAMTLGPSFFAVPSL